jgi:hypothetical protein
MTEQQKDCKTKSQSYKEQLLIEAIILHQVQSRIYIYTHSLKIKTQWSEM